MSDVIKESGWDYPVVKDLVYWDACDQVEHRKESLCGNALVDYNEESFGVVFFIFLSFLLSAWITHVFVCIKTASWILLAIGSFVFPVGIIHGFMVWFS